MAGEPGWVAKVKVARRINIVMGVWLFISAFVWDHTAAERVDTWTLGVLCVLFAATALSVSAFRWLNTALALWLFTSVWELPHRNLGTMWNNAVVAIVIFLASLVPSSDERRPARATA